MQTEAITAIIGLCITAAAAIGRAGVSLHARGKRKRRIERKIAALRAEVEADERSAVVTETCLSIVRAIETSKTPAEIVAKFTVPAPRYEHTFVCRLAAECSTVAQFVGVMCATLHALQTTLLTERHGSTVEFRDHIAHLHLVASTLTFARHSMAVVESSPQCAVRCGSCLLSSLDARCDDENTIALALMRDWEASDAQEPVRLRLAALGPTYAYLLCSSDTAVTIALMSDPALADLPVRVFRCDWAFALLVDDEGTIVSATSTHKNAAYISGTIGQKSDELLSPLIGTLTLTTYAVSVARTVLLATLHKVSSRVVGSPHERPHAELAKGDGLQRVVPEPEDGGE
jgi:hypothetical protein